jgi:hypothetical protein
VKIVKVGLCRLVVDGRRFCCNEVLAARKLNSIVIGTGIGRHLCDGFKFKLELELEWIT